jgi:glutaminase
MIFGFYKTHLGSPTIDYNLEVTIWKDTRFRNAALANFLKSFGNIENDVDTVLDFIFINVP